MDTFRKLLTNLKKYGTHIKRINDIETPKEVKNVDTPTLTLMACLETDAIIERPISDIRENVSDNIRDTECLMEFDEILEDINKDITHDDATLDDIDDVLKNMTEELPKDDYMEVPRFELDNLTASIENLESNDIDITNSLISLDYSSIISITDDSIANSVEENDDIISISSEDSQLVSKVIANMDSETDYALNDKNPDIEIAYSAPVKAERIEHNKNVFMNVEENIEKQSEDRKKYCIIKKTKANEIQTSDVPIETNKTKVKTNEDINNLESYKDINDLTTRDVLLIEDSDDCGYQSSDFEFITEEEAKMDGLIINFKKQQKQKATKSNRVKTIEITVDQFSKKNLTPSRNKISRRCRIADDSDWYPDSDTETSDDESISHNGYHCAINTRSKITDKRGKSQEANKTVPNSLRHIRIFPRINIDSARHLQINSDDPNKQYDKKNSLERTVQELATIQMDCTNENSSLQINCLGHARIHNTTVNPDLAKNNPNSNKMISESEQKKGLYNQKESDAITTQLVINNTGPNQNLARPRANVVGFSIKNDRDANISNPGPRESGKPEKLELNNQRVLRKRHVDDIERWRLYQLRKRSNRQQFVVDYSYRNRHRIYQGKDFHQLFDPNVAPAHTQPRLLENKSIVCKNTTLGEYRGVGFEMQLLRQSGSEDEEVKQEADACAKKIQAMYPDQNTRQRRF